MLKTDCTRVMTGNLNMNSRSNNYVKQSQVHESTHAADVNFINTTINNNNKQTATNYRKYVNDRLNQSVGSTDLENTLIYIKSKSGQFSGEDDITGLKFIDQDFHQFSKKTYEMKLNLDYSQGCYSSHVGLNMYEVVQRQFLGFQLIFKFADHTRSLVHINKYNNVTTNHLMRDLVLQNKSILAYSQDLVIHVIVYGISGYYSDVPLSMWDKKFEITNVVYS